jgi:formylmethanofuran dehydrogenase subunit D
LSLGELLFPKLELKLVIARSSDTEINAAHGKTSTDYRESAARIRMNESDLKRINIKEGSRVSVGNKIGKVVVKAFINDGINSGACVMPYSPWALALVDIPSDTTVVQFHGIDVEVTKSNESVTSLDQLLDSS